MFDFDIFKAPTGGPDPFDRRPTLIFQATPLELNMWGTMNSLGILICCACLVGIIISIDNHSHSGTAGSAFGALIVAALIWHSSNNPPCSVGLNIETRQYKLVKGAGRFKRICHGTFDDIIAVDSYVVEDSRGISGHNVAVMFAGKLGRCDVERLASNERAKARQRAEQLAAILGVPVAELKATK